MDSRLTFEVVILNEVKDPRISSFVLFSQGLRSPTYPMGTRLKYLATAIELRKI